MTMTEINYPTHFNCKIPVLICLAVLLDKLGGTVMITQQDIDKIAYGIVDEGEVTETGALCLHLRQRPKM